MISVRLSEEEYLALRRLCSATGARSISDLTRDAMQTLLRSANGNGLHDIYLDEIRTQMRDLHQKIEQLTIDMLSFKSETKN
jgi:hypothetical protein